VTGGLRKVHFLAHGKKIIGAIILFGVDDFLLRFIWIIFLTDTLVICAVNEESRVYTARMPGVCVF
jgi:hypothetical protein